MNFVSYSIERHRQASRARVRDLIWAAFGEKRVQAKIARAAAKLLEKSDRHVINYMKLQSDPPLYVADRLQEFVAEKTNRLARRIEGQ